MSLTGKNLLGGPEPTYLTEDPGLAERIEAGDEAEDLAARFPKASLAWAMCAEDALAEGRTLEGYAYARVGYHRSLDLLRRNGWKGHGPVPWEHEPNRGFLRALALLALSARAIGETPEWERCSQFLRDSSPAAAAALLD